MRDVLGLSLVAWAAVAMADPMQVDVGAMPRIVFTGDSQTCGCVGAMDYAQMLSPEIPLRVFNRAVGGSNTTHLLSEFGGGMVTATAGRHVVRGTGVSWFSGPYIGQAVRIGSQRYIVDSIQPVDYAKRICDLTLTQPARENYTGADSMFEPGWRVRVADVQPCYACFMFTVNDPHWTSEEFKARLAEITKRCREAGIQPIFLSGVPFEDAESGGAHSGSVEVDKIRPRDMLEFCQQERLPFGDVYRALDWLDPQRTSVWADTIHPTNDGSVLAVHALRHLLRDVGAFGNPYYVHGFRAEGPELPHPTADVLDPIATAQPRRDKDNKVNQAGHTLEAQRLRDEYGLIASRDGQSLRSRSAVLVRIGVGSGRLAGFGVDVASNVPPEAVRVYDWHKREWGGPPKTQSHVGDYVHQGAVWVGLPGVDVTVDYIGLSLQGDVAPWKRPHSDRAILWPRPGEFDWTEQGNLFANGSLASAQDGRPAGWTPRGKAAAYLPEAVVAHGKGEFAGARLTRFKCPGATFTETVRPLDLMVVRAEIEGGPHFRVAEVLDDETIALRRPVKMAPGPVAFEVRRSAGLRAVPGGGCLEVRPGGRWEASLPLERGSYRFGFFYRAFDPAAMNATSRPAVRPSVVLDAASLRDPVQLDGGLDCSFGWLRAWKDLTIAEDCELRVHVGIEGAGAVQYTGFSLEKR